MAEQFVVPNTLRQFTVTPKMPPVDQTGQFGYVSSLNANSSALRAVASALDDRITALALASGVAAQADAAQNIPNLIANGGFNMTTVNSIFGDPPANPVTGVENVEGCPCWFMVPDVAGQIVAEIIDPTVIIPLPQETVALRNGMRIHNNASTPGTGVIYQRVDLFRELELLKGKTVQFGVLYTAFAQDEFHLEIDDGVSVTTNELTTPRLSGADQFSTVSHVVSTSATKLVARIVIDTVIPSLSPLTIEFANFRAGQGAFNVPAQVVGQPTAMDLIAWKMCQQEFSLEIAHTGIHDNSTGGSIPSPAGTGPDAVDLMRLTQTLCVPLVYEDADDLVLQQTNLDDGNLLATRINVLANDPLVLYRSSPWANNGPTAPTVTTVKALVDFTVNIWREAGDPSVSPFDGGFTGVVNLRFDVQHTP